MPIKMKRRASTRLSRFFAAVRDHGSPDSLSDTRCTGSTTTLLAGGCIWLLVMAGTAGAETPAAGAGMGAAQETVVFRDDFTGTTLRPEWQLLNEDADRWTFIDNDYLLFITTSTGQGRKNTLRYEEDLPENYAIVLKVVHPPASGDQDLQLEVWRDGKNGLVLWWTGSGAIGFDKHLRGERNRIEADTGRIARDKPLYLRLKKQGIEYTASWSLDGTSWSNVGTHLFLNLNGREPSFSTANFRYSPPEVGVRFDFVEIRRLP